MEIPVWIERVEQNGYRACAVNGLGLTAEGATRDEAVQRLREAVEKRLAAGAELICLKVPANNPVLRAAGIFKDDPLFEEWQQAIAEYRDQVEKDPNYR